LSLVLLIFSVDAQSIAFVFVHGPWESSSIWDNTIPLLVGQFPKITVALPAHGDSINPSTVVLTDYVNTVVNVINQQGVPVVLVGHGYAGLIISRVAETIPTQITALVYVSVFIPKNGDSLWSVIQNGPLGKYLSVGNNCVNTSAGASEVVFRNCAPGGTVFAAAVATFTTLSEPLDPLQTPVQLGANFAGVAKIAIVTGSDSLISLSAQQAAISGTSNVRQLLLDQSGYTPMICYPRELARYLQSIASGYGVTLGTSQGSGREGGTTEGGRARG